jgi:Glycosyltransferase family 87
MPLGRWRAVAGIAAAAAMTAFAGFVALRLLQQDLVAYWVAGGVRRLGLSPYVNHAVPGTAPLWDGSFFHHSRFLYPPLAAELCRPLALLPYRAAKILFSAALVAAWIATAALARRDGRGLPAALIAGALFFPLFLSFERGQIDLLLLLLIVLAWKARGRAPLSGGLFALAAVFKPALLGVLPVFAALGRWRWLGAVVGWCAAAGVATYAVSGPTLMQEYAADVLPRAALYGEGGTDEMAYGEREMMRVSNDDHGETQSIDGRTYRFTLGFFDRPVSASLPRLLAPDSPSWPTSLLPYLLAAAGLAWAARRVARGPARRDGEPLLLTAALVACVVTSPAGWAMGFVWALPIVPIVWCLRPRPLILAAAWIACALPPPFAGWAAVAGTALAVALGWAATARVGNA